MRVGRPVPGAAGIAEPSSVQEWRAVLDGSVYSSVWLNDPIGGNEACHGFCFPSQLQEIAANAYFADGGFEVGPAEWCRHGEAFVEYASHRLDLLRGQSL